MAKGRPKAGLQALLHAEEVVKTLNLRKQGKTIRAIASELGLSAQAIQKRIETAIKALPQKSAEDLRVRSNGRYDEMWERTEKILAADACDDKTVLAVIDRQLSIEERIAKLNGLDAAIKYAVEAKQHRRTFEDIAADEIALGTPVSSWVPGLQEWAASPAGAAYLSATYPNGLPNGQPLMG